METVKPPMPVRVLNTRNLARLALALTDGSQLLWHFKHKGSGVLALFTAYMYWTGDLPIFAYTHLDQEPKSFLAYRSDTMKGEEWMFTDDADDTRYKYASLIKLKDLPKPFAEALEGEYPDPAEPMLAEVQDLESIIRILLPLSLREGTVFPLWHFTRGGRHILGTCIPFEHYYEADALPVFFYVTLDQPPAKPFVKYTASKPSGEKADFADTTSDAKYFYAKIVDVENLMIFPARERG